MTGAPAAQRTRQRLGVALVPVAALVVHDLRYRLAFGAQADAELRRQGHAYLSALTPLVVLLAALALGWAVVRIRGASVRSAATTRSRLRR